MHLSEEALNDVLIGEASPAAASHLAGCAACRAKVEQTGLAMQLFNKASLAWSETRSITMQAPRVPARGRHLPFATAAWAAVAGLLLVAAVPVWRHAERPAPQPGTMAVSSNMGAEDSETQIAQDNELLKAVDAAINPNEEPSLHEFGLSARPHHRLK